jgi:hypothetical protein
MVLSGCGRRRIIAPRRRHAARARIEGRSQGQEVGLLNFFGFPSLPNRDVGRCGAISTSQRRVV